MGIDKEYLVLQTMYRKKSSQKANVFPVEWYKVKEYELKIAILLECLEKDLLIQDSSLYPQFRLIALSSNR